MKSFINNIVDPILATDLQRKKEIWDVEGRLKNGNQTFKFDIRLSNLSIMISQKK